MNSSERLPNCQRCKKKWSWKDTIKGASVLSDKGINCPHCKKKQYLTKKSKRNTNMSIFFIIAPLALFYNISPLAGVLSLAGAGLLFIIIWPYLVELTNEEN